SRKSTTPTGPTDPGEARATSSGVFHTAYENAPRRLAGVRPMRSPCSRVAPLPVRGGLPMVRRNWILLPLLALGLAFSACGYGSEDTASGSGPVDWGGPRGDEGTGPGDGPDDGKGPGDADPGTDPGGDGDGSEVGGNGQG